MALRTRFVEIDKDNAQKLLDQLHTISKAEALHRKNVGLKLQSCDLQLLKRFPETSAAYVYALEGMVRAYSGLRDMVRSAVVSIRRQEETCSVIDSIRQQLEVQGRVNVNCDYVGDLSAMTNLFPRLMERNYLRAQMTDAAVKYYNSRTGMQFLSEFDMSANLPEGFVAFVNFAEVSCENEPRTVTTKIKQLAAQGLQCTLFDLTVRLKHIIAVFFAGLHYPSRHSFTRLGAPTAADPFSWKKTCAKKGCTTLRSRDILVL